MGVNLLRDIRFWIVFFFLLRLHGITNPPLESAHSWRQTTVTMVARNFYEVDNNPLYPRIDIAGEKTGITGMEAPVLNYCIYVMAEVFGYQHWYGRLINLLVSSLGLYFFYRLLRKYFSEETAFYAAMILCVSIWFAYSRKIMPDTFSMSLLIMGFYYGSNYIERDEKKKQWMWLVACFALTALGVLAKLPSGYCLVLWGLYLTNTCIPIRRRAMLFMVMLIAVLPAVVWYFYWVPYLVKTYGFWHFFMGKPIGEGMREILMNGQLTAAHFYDYALKYIGFATFLIGVSYAILRKETILLRVVLLSLLAFSVVIFKAGETFALHSYYIIPFVPVMALMAAYGLSSLPSKPWRIAIILFIVVEGVGNQQHDFSIRPKDAAIANIDKQLDVYCKHSDLLLINSGDVPTPMYFAHRKGWLASNEKIQDKEYVTSLKQKGLKFVLILKRSFGTAIRLNYPKVADNMNFCLYKLN